MEDHTHWAESEISPGAASKATNCREVRAQQSSCSEPRDDLSVSCRTPVPRGETSNTTEATFDLSISWSPDEPGRILIPARYVEVVQVLRAPANYQRARIPGRLIQVPDCMDSFFRFSLLPFSTSPQTFPPSLCLSVLRNQIMPQFHPHRYFYLFFGPGGERSRRKWPDMVISAPFLIMAIQVNHSQFSVLLFNQRTSDKRSR